MYLAEVSVNRPVFTTMIISALVVFGLICYTMIGVDLFPNIDFPYVTVMKSDSNQNSVVFSSMAGILLSLCKIRAAS
jgi:HAE1 family hydrophobic/amphiphilic exporter-1